MIEVSESIESITKAVKENLYLYAPLGIGDQINLEARYWAKIPHSLDDVKLGSFTNFNDNSCALLPETWAEAQILEQQQFHQSNNSLRNYEPLAMWGLPIAKANSLEDFSIIGRYLVEQLEQYENFFTIKSYLEQLSRGKGHLPLWTFSEVIVDISLTFAKISIEPFLKMCPQVKDEFNN